MATVIDITGRRFSRWVVLSLYAKGAGAHATWVCQCDCGTRSVVDGVHLRRGKTRSCGCLRTEQLTTHGYTAGYTRSTYRIWDAMRQRCTNPNHSHYRRYGGRGISVCHRWLHSFEDFLADMGPRPEGYSIERINNDGNYEPSNCKWIPLADQQKNRTYPYRKQFMDCTPRQQRNRRRNVSENV